ncbi:MAG: iron ABC transporter permease [Candidatus Nanoarchaeia archaeon]
MTSSFASPSKHFKNGVKNETNKILSHNFFDDIFCVISIVAEGMKIGYIKEIIRNPIYREGILNAFAVAFVCVVLVSIIAIPLALLHNSFDFIGKNFISPLLLLPIILPPFVGALGYLQIFGRFGVLNSFLCNLGIFDFVSCPDWLGGRGRFFAVCFVEAMHLYPIMYLNVLASLGNLDPSLDEAARNIGCGSVKRFFRITFPLIRPGFFAGASIVFIWSFTELGTPLMLGFNRISAVQIFNGITELETNPLPYALVVVLLFVSCGLYALSRFAFGGNTDMLAVKGMQGTQSKQVKGITAFIVLLPFLIVLVFAALPHLGIILLSVSEDWHCSVLPKSYTFEHFQNALAHPLVVPAIMNSLRFSSLAMFLALITGIILALMTIRWKSFAWQIFDILGMLPLAVPGIVLAFGYLSMSTKHEFLRSTMDPIRNPTILLVIAYTMRRLPYVLRSVVAGLQQTPPDLEYAALNLGACNRSVFFRITLPLLMPNIVIGALFAFSFSMLEVSDSLVLAQKIEFFPITRAIFELSQLLGSGPYLACAFGVWTMVFFAVTLFIASAITGNWLKVGIFRL